MQGATIRNGRGDGQNDVSIHAPYAGSDGFRKRQDTSGRMFQSTPPMQGATGRGGSDANVQGVSIHAPYAGSDSNT